MEDKIIGCYRITCIKEDYISNPLCELLATFTVLSIVCPSLTAIFLGSFGVIDTSMASDIIMLSALVGFGLFMGSLFIKQGGCGVKIYLTDERSCRKYSAMIIEVMFSGNVNADAVKIKKSIDKCIKVAKERIDMDNDVEKEKELCCNQYKEVMKVVENEHRN